MNHSAIVRENDGGTVATSTTAMGATTALGTNRFEKLRRKNGRTKWD